MSAPTPPPPPPSPGADGSHRPVSPAPPPPYAPPYAAAPYQVVNDEQRRVMETKGRRAVAFGVVWILIGLVVSLFTYSKATSMGGGPYLLFWGPVAYGVYRMVSGRRLINRSRD